MKNIIFLRSMFALGLIFFFPSISSGNPTLRSLVKYIPIGYSSITVPFDKDKPYSEQAPLYKGYIGSVCSLNPTETNGVCLSYYDYCKNLSTHPSQHEDLSYCAPYMGLCIGDNSTSCQSVWSSKATICSHEEIKWDLPTCQSQLEEHKQTIRSLQDLLNFNLEDSKEKLFNKALEAAEMYNAEGNVFKAWQALGEAGDFYAQKCSEIFGPTHSFFKFVVTAHWHNIADQEVFYNHFHKYGMKYQKNYIKAVKEKGGYPDTHEIEHLYSKTLKQMNLPQTLAIDLLHNSVPNSTWSKKLQSGGASMLHLVGVPLGGFSLKKDWHDYMELSDHSPERVSTDKLGAGTSSASAQIALLKTSLNTVFLFIRSAFDSKLLHYDTSYRHEHEHEHEDEHDLGHTHDHPEDTNP